MDLLIATKNPGKWKEIADMFAGLPLTLRRPPDNLPVLEETGTTHMHNALLKAHYYFEHVRIPTLAEDSGVHVDALPGQLGAKTRRFGEGEGADDATWLKHFLETMKEQKNRRARFCCAVAIAGVQDLQVFLGETEGVITETIEASILPGLPLSSCFRPDGCQKVYAALSPQEKARVSHRGKAILRARKFIERYLTK